MVFVYGLLLFVLAAAGLYLFFLKRGVIYRPSLGDTRIVRKGDVYLIEQYLQVKYHKIWQPIDGQMYDVKDVSMNNPKMFILKMRAAAAARRYKEDVERRESVKHPVVIFETDGTPPKRDPNDG